MTAISAEGFAHPRSWSEYPNVFKGFGGLFIRGKCE